MNGTDITRGLLKIGNVIKNVIDGKPALDIDPDILIDGKITKLTANFIYSHNVVIDKNLQYLESKTLGNIVQTEVLIFSGVLLQAFRVMTEIHGVSPKMTINKLSSNNNDFISDLRRGTDLIAGREEIDYFKDAFVGGGVLPISVGLEKVDSSNSHTGRIENNTSIQKDTSLALTTYEVQLTVRDKNGSERGIVIPVMISPNIIFEDMDTFVNNMLDSNDDKTLFSRIDQMRASAISVLDLILATDLVDEYKRKKINNRNSFASYLNSMDKTSSLKDLLHNRNSFSKRFNIYIFDVNSMPTINRLVKGDVYKDKYKDEVLDKLMGFSMSFVDVEKETLVRFISDIKGFAVLDFAMLKKDKDSDIVNIVKEMMKNRQPF